MKMFSLDPGEQTGLVVDKISHRPESATIAIVEQHTLVSVAEILEIVDAHRCAVGVMETRPRNGTTLGLNVYNKLFHQFLSSKFLASTVPKMNKPSISKPQLILIGPGLWKPFMASRSRNIPVMKSQHEKDAVMLLHYLIQINHPGKEVRYG